MIELLRSFFIVLEEGSLNRAATRLHITQPSLTRQMQSLENEIGGPLLERQPSGVKPTALGQATVARMHPFLEQYDHACADLRRQARGQRAELRIGYIGSAAHTYLNPALTGLRHQYPEAKVKLLDLSPGEQIAALKKGNIDLALIGQEGASLSLDFYKRKLVTLGVCVVLPSDHPLASRRELRPIDLKNEAFIGAPDSEVPGRNQWIVRICRKASFRPKFVADAASIGEGFSLIASEGAVTLLPDYFAQTPPPGVKLVPLIDEAATWDLLLLWQRGRPPAVLKAMIELLTQTARQTRAAFPA
ncbi:MAG TPA: LysR family transcriptional regulator [Chthoniobacterales bacterium]